MKRLQRDSGPDHVLKGRPGALHVAGQGFLEPGDKCAVTVGDSRNQANNCWRFQTAGSLQVLKFRFGSREAFRKRRG